jgi:hypothetical protein
VLLLAWELRVGLFRTNPKIGERDTLESLPLPRTPGDVATEYENLNEVGSVWSLDRRLG